MCVEYRFPGTYELFGQAYFCNFMYKSNYGLVMCFQSVIVCYRIYFNSFFIPVWMRSSLWP